jgi:hypothetical protein
MKMKRWTLITGAALAVVASAALAFATAHAETQPVTTSHETAIKACSTVNPAQPVEIVNAVEDGSGIGFSLVWLNDKDGKLWMCDADSDGNVYSYSLVTQDLLEGAGPEMLGLTEADFSQVDPQETAQKVCVAYLTQGGKVLASAPDGYEQDPGFAVFIKANQDGGTYLCNATSDAKIWAFEPIGDPLSLEQQVS